MELEERVGRLERENRRLKAAGGVVLLLLGSVFLLGQASPDVVDEIKARRISIYDENGKLRAALASEGMGIYDENQKERVSLNSVGLGISDENGELRAAVGSAGLVLQDENERRALLISGGLAIFDENRRLAATYGDSRVPQERR